MMPRLAVLLLGSAFVPALAGPAAAVAADGLAIDRLGGFKGECASLVIAGVPARCADDGGVVYMHLRNKRTIWMVGLADGRSALAFIGESTQKAPGNGSVLQLTRVRAGNDPNADPVPVTGTCTFSAKGASPEALLCQAIGDDGRSYRLDFRADGTPFSLKQF
jgi:hypothetical protein